MPTILEWVPTYFYNQCCVHACCIFSQTRLAYGLREEAAAAPPTTKCKNCKLHLAKKAVSKKCFYKLSAFIWFVLCNNLFLVWHGCNNSNELQSTSYISLAVFLISCRVKIVYVIVLNLCFFCVTSENIGHTYKPSTTNYTDWVVNKN